MSKHETQPLAILVDEYGNRHERADELARGGQGVVYKTTDADLAVKQPLVPGTDKLDTSKDCKTLFRRVRTLPIPPHIPVSLPLAILRDEPGYVMRLLDNMKSFGQFESKDLEGYAATGSACRRFYGLSQCASILARLHAAGLVYGDISTNNVFIGEGDDAQVWLIDADNLCLEAPQGSLVYTPHYGAPEIVQKKDCGRPRSDCWAFAVMAFKLLTLNHPFIGKKVQETENDEDAWDAAPPADGAPSDLDEQAYAGYLPWIYDECDASNHAIGGLPPELVLTPRLLRLFQKTFGAGRTQPHHRPTMPFWALELACAFDQSLTCPKCGMSYIHDQHEKCPYCDTPRPAYAMAHTPRGEKVFTKSGSLPHRMIHPFSLEHGGDILYEAEFDFTVKRVRPVRGTENFPSELTFEFKEAEK